MWKLRASPRPRNRRGPHLYADFCTPILRKPLAGSAAESTEIKNIAIERNLANCTCHNLRYYPQVQHMRRLCEAGELGAVLAVQGTYSLDWPLCPSDWNWCVDTGGSRVFVKDPLLLAGKARNYSDLPGATAQATMTHSSRCSSAFTAPLPIEARQRNIPNSPTASGNYTSSTRCSKAPVRTPAWM